jgi:hypothetical protein
MLLTDESIQEFIKLCEEHLGFSPTKEEAAVQANRLIYLAAIIQPPFVSTNKEIQFNSSHDQN